ncbi:MAG TPA: hypothetical protein VF764_05200 [Steroidobacteraceae bacterium]
MRLHNTLSALLILRFLALPAEAQNLLSAQQWRQDLHYLAEQIIRVHPAAFHNLTEQDFNSAVADLDRRIPALSDQKVEVELIRLVASLGEGHSRVSPPGLPDPMSDVAQVTPFKDPRLAFHRLPLQLYRFSDGLYVIAATPEWQSLVGSRVAEIGGHDALGVLETLQPLVNRDNDMGTLLVAPQLAVVPEILQAMRLIADPSRVAVVLQPPAGREVRLDLRPLAAGEQAEWRGAPSAERAEYLRHAQENFWAGHLAESGINYARINVLEDSPARTVTMFAHDVGVLTRAHPRDRLVIDFRGSRGGDNQKFRALLLEMIRNGAVNQPGRLFVIIDRGSFSAAVNAVSDLERLTNSILIGEPTAGASGSWGDPQKIVLPNSGLIARISTIYWSDWLPGNVRRWIAPDIASTLTSTDYFAGRDPALQAIERFTPEPGFESVAGNLVQLGAGLGTIERLYYQRKTDPLWAGESTEQAMQHIGSQLVSRKSYRDALIVFTINHMDYPGSIGGALQTVQSAEASNPRDPGLEDLARSLLQLKRQQ